MGILIWLCSRAEYWQLYKDEKGSRQIVAFFRLRIFFVYSISLCDLVIL
jgi:hypothetical protein